MQARWLTELGRLHKPERESTTTSPTYSEAQKKKNVRKNLGTITFFSDRAFVTSIVFTNEQILSSARLRHHLGKDPGRAFTPKAGFYLTIRSRPSKSVTTVSIYSEALKTKNVKS